MPDHKSDLPTSSRCCKEGRFVHKGACFALETSDGDFWLEMDRIPLDLIERRVRVEGLRFAPNLLLVEAIALA